MATKGIWISVLCSMFLVGTAAAADKPVLKDQKDKESYTIGYQMGEDFRKFKMAIEPDLVAKGIRDALGQKKPLLNDDERRAALTDLNRRMRVAREDLSKEQGAQNLAAGEKFLAENKIKEGVKTLPSGLQYRVVKEGTGPSPTATDTVTVHYRGTLIDGTEFDSSHTRGTPATFRVDGVIRGWTEALQLMKTGSTWQIFIPPQLAYGERGAGPRIGPNSTLIFDVELISIGEKKTQ